MPMSLNQLFPQAERDLLIRELTLDSRGVRPGDLFLAVPGGRQDGRAHIADALAKGAAAVAYEAEGAGELPPSDAPLIAVKGLAAQLSAVAGRFYGEPSRGLDLIGVTGTNGKTSVSQLVAQALDLLGERCGIVGTLGTGFYGALESGRHTTPDPLAVQATLATFDIAVFTNLSRDHLDYHGSMEAYAAAKAKLFAWPGLRCRVINLDDDFGRRLAGEEQDSELITYSLTDSSAFLYCREARFGDAGIEAALVTPHGEGLLRSPLLGRFNLSNLLAAVGALLGLGYPLGDILRTLPQLQGPVGRMQRLGGGDKPLVVVDYAHTPDALEKVLEALRPHAAARLLCLFGCGGDRDAGKRPLMAAIAERLADGVLVTDDNPRTEASAAIIADIRKGFAAADKVTFLPSRGEAIAHLIASAAVDDVVLLAGKGHEDYQEIDGVRHPFSDIEQAERALAAWEVPHA
ncbi:Mur ligase family protein [Pseudomonas aeruginosa]|uniref:Mur ligase family protein n=1 Tax=Pseudomonas aeruginosa TaxID=287 RepID=UPI00104A50F2|nr:UDP-N-acetylmuramoyl-L-alanyl-D-glutamate--2,6-diaminopimelate ligase [Pseudomonas aeruginosa]